MVATPSPVPTDGTPTTVGGFIYEGASNVGAMSSTTERQRVASDRAITRRRMLGGAVATTALLAGVPRPSSARSQPPVALSNQQLRDRIRTIDADPTAMGLQQMLRQEGWERDRSATTGHHAPDLDGHEVVAISYDHPSRAGQAVLLWSDSDAIDTQIRRFTPERDGRTRMVTTVGTRRASNTTTAIVPPDRFGLLCTDINWSCLLSIAGAWAGTFATCSSCLLDPSRLTCLSCASSAVSAAGTTLGCSPCNG